MDCRCLELPDKAFPAGGRSAASGDMDTPPYRHKKPRWETREKEEKGLYSMFKFLLICPTPALKKNFDPRNTTSMPVVKIFYRLGFEQIT